MDEELQLCLQKSFSEVQCLLMITKQEEKKKKNQLLANQGLGVCTGFVPEIYCKGHTQQRNFGYIVSKMTYRSLFFVVTVSDRKEL